MNRLALLVLYMYLSFFSRSASAFKVVSPSFAALAACRRSFTSLSGSSNADLAAASSSSAAAVGRRSRAGTQLARSCCYSPKEIAENKDLIISHMLARCGGDSSKARHYIEW